MKLTTLVKTNTKVAKPSIRRYCKHCKLRFTTKLKSKVYCSDKCKSAATYHRKTNNVEKRLFRAQGSAFFYWVAQQAIRSNTLQILEGHTVESMVALYNLFKESIKMNGTGSTERLYVLSHIYAANPDSSSEGVGALFADNLIVCPALDNQRHGNAFKEGTGHSIPRSSLKLQHHVHSDESPKAVIKRIVEFLGEDLVEKVVVKAKVQPTARIKLFAWFEKNGIKAPSEKLSTQQLQTLKDEYLGKENGKGFVFRLEAYTPTEVYAVEMERLSASEEAQLYLKGVIWLDLIDIPHDVIAKAHMVCFKWLHQEIPDATPHLAHYLKSYIDINALVDDTDYSVIDAASPY
ncbi:hypothetical protein [Streptomyces microflavus]|uniref:hypothetical protein n=1 Tax=Streptomyces microflavus TaxID=1919 RepID=UPI0036346A41